MSESRPGSVIRHDAHPQTPGDQPGLEHPTGGEAPPEPGSVRITCCDYSPHNAQWMDVTDLERFLEQPPPQWARVRWVHVQGLDLHTIRRFKERFDLHTLAAEDVLHIPQRPKVEPYPEHLLVIARRITLDTGRRLTMAQIAMFLKEDLLITFEQTTGERTAAEEGGDGAGGGGGEGWTPIRRRIDNPASHLRQRDASFLLYALLDSVVDHCFPLLEAYGDELEELDQQVLEDPDPAMLQQIHGIRRELSNLRRVLWPTRETVDRLCRDERLPIDPFTRTYLRDVHDHTLRVLDMTEAYRESTIGLSDLYMSTISNRMNEVMKVLTIIATLFIPITFLAGVFGMNFEYMPMLKWKWGYPLFWGVCIAIIVVLLVYFARKRWL